MNPLVILIARMLAAEGAQVALAARGQRIQLGSPTALKSLRRYQGLDQKPRPSMLQDSRKIHMRRTRMLDTQQRSSIIVGALQVETAQSNARAGCNGGGSTVV
jgi:hypothetical protein